MALAVGTGERVGRRGKEVFHTGNPGCGRDGGNIRLDPQTRKSVFKLAYREVKTTEKLVGPAAACEVAEKRRVHWHAPP